VGAFQAVAETRAEEAKGYHVVYVTCRFEKMMLDMKIVLDSSNRVAGFSFVPLPPKIGWSQPSYAKPDSFLERGITVGSAECRSGLSTPADYDVPQHVSEAVIEDVAAWVRAARR
jgi:hypothetical protein